jgi:hypothetical protein
VTPPGFTPRVFLRSLRDLKCTNLFASLKVLARYENTTKKRPKAFFYCEPTVPEVEPQALFDSLVSTYEKLKSLGFTYYNGKVVIIESEEEVSHV